MDSRLISLQNWLHDHTEINVIKLEPASEDASFRRYFRIFDESGSYIAMDAPPEHETIDAFLAIAKLLADIGLHAPQIHYSNAELGFIVLEDLGAQTYLSELGEHHQALYADAIDALIKLQSIDLAAVSNASIENIPSYDGPKLAQEMDLFRTWFLERHLENYPYEAAHAVWLMTKQFLISECVHQPQVLVHRDFHSRNLMICQDNSPGVIDFQDMVIGPIAYDLASIFKDCYIEWPREQQLDWLRQYHNALASKFDYPIFSFEQLLRWYDLSGLQRHLKVLGIFCRLHYRDAKTAYLNDLPLVARYVLDVLPRYPELREFEHHYQHLIEKVL